jgi:hypothetical protein
MSIVLRPDRRRWIGAAVGSALAASALSLFGPMPASAQGRAAAKTAEPQGPTKEFTTSDRTNADWARRLGIPVYFAVPGTSRAALPKTFNTTDRLIDFRHPDAKSGDVGLRIIAARRAGMGRRLAQSGLLQTGDIVLTFRPEWGGAGAYPNIQMGVSHAGLVFVRDGVAHQLDNPMDATYLGPNFNGDFNNEHYRTLSYLHVVRPRSLTEAQRETIAAWANRLMQNARKVYPQQIAFNQDYNAPKVAGDKSLGFVMRVAQAALGHQTASKTDLFCSEFVWSVLALRDCDPVGNAEDFKGTRVPSCVKPIMEPLRVVGAYPVRRSNSSDIGLADGPLVVVQALNLEAGPRDKLLESIFVENAARASKMSVGHRKLAADLSPKYAPLQSYYKDAAHGGTRRMNAWFVASQFRRAVPDNYSPTSFLINTLLPFNSSSRTMDYVATIALE